MPLSIIVAGALLVLRLPPWSSWTFNTICALSSQPLLVHKVEFHSELQSDNILSGPQPENTIILITNWIPLSTPEAGSAPTPFPLLGYILFTFWSSLLPTSDRYKWWLPWKGMEYSLLKNLFNSFKIMVVEMWLFRKNRVYRGICYSSINKCTYNKGT